MVYSPYKVGELIPVTKHGNSCHLPTGSGDIKVVHAITAAQPPPVLRFFG